MDSTIVPLDKQKIILSYILELSDQFPIDPAILFQTINNSEIDIHQVEYVLEYLYSRAILEKNLFMKLLETVSSDPHYYRPTAQQIADSYKMDVPNFYITQSLICDWFSLLFTGSGNAQNAIEFKTRYGYSFIYLGPSAFRTLVSVIIEEEIRIL
jgi:hypothetical protein